MAGNLANSWQGCLYEKALLAALTELTVHAHPELLLLPLVVVVIAAAVAVAAVGVVMACASKRLCIIMFFCIIFRATVSQLKKLHYL
jgi:hypothetical protein